MIIDNLVVGSMQVNSYILANEENNEALLVDPGDDGDKILSFIKEKQYKIKYIVLTHAHYDHIGALKKVRDNLYYEDNNHPQIVIHNKESKGLNDSSYNLSRYMSLDCESVNVDIEIEEGEYLVLGNKKIKIVHTPGHTGGGICLYVDNILISGDTLFRENIGRTDLPSGNYSVLVDSVKNKLLTLPDDVVVYPGHGEFSTIAIEKERNPYV